MTIVKAVRAQSYRDWKLHIIVDTGDTAYRQRIEEIACRERMGRAGGWARRSQDRLRRIVSTRSMRTL